MYYPGLRQPQYDECRNFVVDRLVSLRAGLTQDMPEKHLEGNVIVGSWNIRDFGGRRLNPEPRLPESYYYIAEIISNFDILALQEINENLADLERVMRLLGNNFDYLVTDVAEVEGGNQERIAFVYDKRKVSFKNIAGEIVLPKKGYEIQFSRTPFVVSFQSGWFKFDLCSSHLFYGATSGPKYKQRVAEIRALAKFMEKRSAKTQANTFILGDFNVEKPGKPTWEALHESGFEVPEELQQVKTNIGEDKHYDQIAFHSSRKEVKMVPVQLPNGKKVSGDKFKFFDYVFRDEDEAEYRKANRTKKLGNSKKKYREWSTWQISDHYPIWIVLQTDFTDSYLRSLVNTKTPLIV